MTRSITPGARASRAPDPLRGLLSLLGLLVASPHASAATTALTQLSIEELGQIEVSSASRRPERLEDAPAAVVVITRDQIRRAGVTTLAEALRLAPNLQVARITSSDYAITARGGNGPSANKLLVMIDGRTVYTPLHSGVFWDAQDTLLADVDRIEVASGPGGTLWGANAVNGVINVVTRSSKDTRGTLVEPVIGTDDRGLSLRHGWGDGDTSVRVYAKRFLHDHTQTADGTPVADAWANNQAGFRADGGRPVSAWTLQGDAYDGRAQVPASPDRHVSGGNVLGRWTSERGSGGWQVQAYLDTYRRDQPGLFTERLDTFDIDVQQQLRWGDRHEFVWGGGLRRQHDRTSASPLFAFVPADSRLTLANVFAQDTLALAERVKLTVGLKLERNSFTGLEVQPNVRIAWKRNAQSLAWAALSRAVRTPSRLDRDFQVFVNLGPPYNGRLLGGPGFMSERNTAWEIGYRGQPTPRLSYSVNAYHHEYTRLRSIEPSGADYVLGNGIAGHATGLEGWGSWQVDQAWRVGAGLTLLNERLRFSPTSRDPGSPDIGGDDPKHQFQLRASWNGPRALALDVGLRHVGALPSPAVPAYTAVDARLAWSPRPDLELSLTGFNLFDARHPEFGAAPGRSELGRRFLLRASWAL
jgi:iron complex outermembrane receptor protein